MAKRTKKDYIPHVEGTPPRCDTDGCSLEGLYKAPKSRTELNQYRWLCLDHIREYNNQWDFFSGMEQPDIERFMKEALTGHRPTWTREGQAQQWDYEQLQEALNDFINAPPTKKKSRLPAKLGEAVALLDIEYPFTTAALKKAYRSLVKKHHPDVNKGDPKSEEKFKEITAAYLYLSRHLPPA